MKGSRLILPGCTGFIVSDPDAGEFLVIGFRHYRIICRKLNEPSGPLFYIPRREFELLDFPKQKPLDLTPPE